MTGRGNLRVIEGSANQRWDALQKYVRVVSREHRGFVEFRFAIGDPGLYLEMILPEAAFEAFCTEHRVRFVDDAETEAIDRDERKWKYGTPGGAGDDENDDAGV